MATDLVRCDWAGTDPAMIDYHDREWGVPLHDEHRLFEMLVLEGAQAGLSWSTILNKRARYREQFEGFDPERVARFDERRIERLLTDPGIVRNRAKVRAAVGNARAVLEIREATGEGFDRFIWELAGRKPKRNRWRSMRQVPASTPRSEAMSRELKRRGMRFVGPTICYAFMQATGMVDDHLVRCHRHGAGAAQN